MTSYRLRLDLTENETQHLVDCVFISADASAGDDTQAHEGAPETLEVLTERLYGKVLAASRAAGYEPVGFNGPFAGRAATVFPVGTRVRFTQTVERFPHFIVPVGARGTVTVNELPEAYNVRLDYYEPGAKEWENEVCWNPENNGPEDTPEELEAVAHWEDCRDAACAECRALLAGHVHDDECMGAGCRGAQVKWNRENAAKEVR